MLQNIIINTLAFGGTYAVLAVGFSLIFGVARLANFGHTAFYMIAAFMLFYGINTLQISLAPIAAVAILIPILIGLLYYQFVIDRVKQHELAVVITTSAMALIFQEIFIMLFTAEHHSVEPFVRGYVEILDIRVSYQHIISILASFTILAGLMLFLSRTKWGNAIRAVSQNAAIANLMGINVGRVFLITMGIAAGLAALAGVVTAPIVAINPYMWSTVITVILAAAVIGGLGSIKGSLIGAFILAFSEVLVTTLIPGGSFLRGVASLVGMVVVLAIRPEGLFGVVFEEERL